MMRVVGKATVVAIALSLVVTGSVMAAGQGPLGPISTSSIFNDGSGGISPRDFLGTGFEQSEGYNLGTISNVNGWKCRLQNTTTPPGALCGGQVVAKGNGSAQGLQNTQNFNYPNGTFAGSRSPTITSTQLTIMNWDFRMDDNGGSNYLVQPQQPTAGLLTFRFQYAYNGYMYAWGVDPLNPGFITPYNVGLWDTSWNTYQAVLVKTDPTPANWYYNMYSGPDKDHLTQLCDIVDGTCNFLLAGTTYEEVLFMHDNFQNTGLGNFAGDGPGVSYVDNVSIKPEPGTLAMLGAGLLIALRRKSGR